MLQLMVGDSVSNPHADCLAVLANRAIRSGTVVIDVGADDGSWTKAALSRVPGITVHCLEPKSGAVSAIADQSCIADRVRAGGAAQCIGGVDRSALRAAWSSLQQFATSAV